MARAHFRFAVGPVGGHPGAPLRAGDAAEVTVVAETPKAHDNVKLVWAIGWTVEGRRTSSSTIGHGARTLGRIEARTPAVERIRRWIPQDGPVSYEGKLLRIFWWLKVRLDIPWAFDPDGRVHFLVLPREEVPTRPQVTVAPRAKLVVAAKQGVVCPFCRDTIDDRERVACPKCGTGHHSECYQLYGGCTIPGCHR